MSYVVLSLGGVHKQRLQDEVGRWSKNFHFLSYHRKCQHRGVGGQKSTNLVNVVCERPLMVKYRKKTHQDHVDAIDASVTEHVIELIWHFYS